MSGHECSSQAQAGSQELSYIPNHRTKRQPRQVKRTTAWLPTAWLPYWSSEPRDMGAAKDRQETAMPRARN